MSYFKGETVSKQYEFTDKDGAYVDPDTISVKIFSPTGNLEDTPSLSKIETGKYELNYNLAVGAASGTWKIFVEAVKGSWSRKDLQTFEVVVPPG